MTAKVKTYILKFGAILGGFLLAMIFAIPYIVFREEIQSVSSLGYMGLLLACAISNASVFLPSSSTVIVLAAASTLNPLLCIVFGGMGTALGEQVSYLCGRLGASGFAKELSEKEAKIILWLRSHAFWTVFWFAFVPLPVFDFVGVASGVLRINWLKYATAAVLGKVLKFAITLVAVYYLLPIMIDCLPGQGSEMLKQLIEQLYPTN